MNIQKSREPQSKFWKQIPQQAAWYNSSSKFQRASLLKLGTHYPPLMRDNSTCASNFAALVFSESHYNLPIPTCDLV